MPRSILSFASNTGYDFGACESGSFRGLDDLRFVGSTPSQQATM
jgi:hypothetical protein